MPSGVVNGAEWDKAPEVLRRDNGLLGNILKHNSGLPICGSQQTDGILDSQMGFSDFFSLFLSPQNFETLPQYCCCALHHSIFVDLLHSFVSGWDAAFLDESHL